MPKTDYLNLRLVITPEPRYRSPRYRSFQIPLKKSPVLLPKNFASVHFSITVQKFYLPSFSNVQFYSKLS